MSSIRKSLVSLVVGVGLILSTEVQTAFGDEKLTDVWIFNGSNPDLNVKTPDRKTFRPFDVYPADEAKKNVFIDDKVAASKLDSDAKGTVWELGFRLKREAFAGIRVTPDGAPAGKNAGIDVKRMLFLDSEKPVFMVVRARTAKGATAKVEFKIGGVSGENHKDGTNDDPWKFAESIEAKLEDKWVDYEIPLKGKHKELASLACGLTVAVEGSANDGKMVTVYIESIRITTKR